MRFKKFSTAFIVIALLTALTGVNYAGQKFHRRWDFTKLKRFTLSDKTREIISGLKEPVKITAFIAEGSGTGSDIKNLLKEYDFASEKIKVEFFDPEKNPAMAKKYNVQDYNTIVVEDLKHRRIISPYNLYSPGSKPYLMDFNGEQAVTRAILDLNQQTRAGIYFLKGHGEASLISDLDKFNSYLKGEGYVTNQLDLAVEAKIPGDASLIVVAGPQKDIADEERKTLENYLKHGGKLLILFGPTDPGVSMNGWKNLLSSLGLKAHDDLVVDPARSFYSDPLTPVPMAEYHQTTQILLDKKLTVIFPYSRSLEPLKNMPPGLQVRSLLVTSDSAFGETDLAQNQVKPDKDDIAGPLHLAYAVSKPANSNSKEAPVEPNTLTAADEDTGEPVAVVVGNVAFLSPESLGLAGNLDFASGAIGWLMQSTNMLNIPARSEEPAFVNLTGDMARIIFYSTVVGLPSIIVIVGFIIWWKRRNL